ncbi:MAG: hypothetical protein CVV33_01330 [Methanomicrobiales archaeon HGW-Methanomicrobiales-4]|nr:MAG: hypothetical protein CVV33_01330 [Methanomicrobiales archaeon HGW-Methanomicrobiales-4]
MNRRYLILAIIIIFILIGTVAAKTAYTVCNPSDPGCSALIEEAWSQGYANFAYDDAAPYTTLGLSCCWWERLYKLSRFSRNSEGEYNTNTLGLSAGGEESSSVSTTSSSDSVSSAQVETKSYCPSCCATCDDDDPSALKARSDAIMAKKPWLTEGINNKQPSATPTVTATPTVAQMVMTFSEAI